MQVFMKKDYKKNGCEGIQTFIRYICAGGIMDNTSEFEIGEPN